MQYEVSFPALCSTLSVLLGFANTIVSKCDTGQKEKALKISEEIGTMSSRMACIFSLDLVFNSMQCNKRRHRYIFIAKRESISMASLLFSELRERAGQKAVFHVSEFSYSHQQIRKQTKPHNIYTLAVYNMAIESVFLCFLQYDSYQNSYFISSTQQFHHSTTV